MSRVINRNEFTGMAIERSNALWDIISKRGHELREESPGNYFFTKDGEIMGEFETRRNEDGKAIEVPVTMDELELSGWMGEQLIEVNSKK